MTQHDPEADYQKAVQAQQERRRAKRLAELGPEAVGLLDLLLRALLQDTPTRFNEAGRLSCALCGHPHGPFYGADDHTPDCSITRARDLLKRAEGEQG